MVTAIAGILIVSVLTVTLFFYGNVIRGNLQARLAVESQNILRSVVEDLRISSGIRANNTITDPSVGGWSTSNSSLILIVASPAVDSSNNFIIDTSTGYPYQNEIIYFANGGRLYKRFLAHPDASGNKLKTSCPAASSSPSCPPDVILSSNFETMNFVFYDQDDNITTTLPQARSIGLAVMVKRKSFGKDLKFDNKIRITLRNNTG